MWATELFLLGLPRTQYYIQTSLDFSESCASGCWPNLNLVEMGGALLQARGGLNEEVGSLPYQERVDPTVKESGDLQ